MTKTKNALIHCATVFLKNQQKRIIKILTQKHLTIITGKQKKKLSPKSLSDLYSRIFQPGLLERETNIW